MQAVFEENAGYLRPERCTAAHQALAIRHGAELRFSEEVTGWETDGDGVVLTTRLGEHRAERLVITTGPWAVELLAGLGLPLEVERIVNVHFQPSRPELFTEDRCPIYIWQVPEGWYYGFPHMPGSGLKLGRHENGEVTTARTIRRSIDQAEIDQLRAMLDRYMPGASGEVVKTLTCMYTNTPDEHFILDQHPSYPQVVFGCGFSGHGFKFASVIGEILADLAVDGVTEHDIRFLSQTRFARVA
jgi:sarcosine oxidase